MTSITFFFIFIPILAIILLAVNLIFAPHNPYQEKNGTFECGFTSFLGQNRTQFSISFFIFALLFLLFDLEILLVYPYLVSSYTNEAYGLFVLLLFLLALALGFAFELGKKALNIDSRQMHKTTDKQLLTTTMPKSTLLLINNKRTKIIKYTKGSPYGKRGIIGTFIAAPTTILTSVGAASVVAGVLLYALLFNQTPVTQPFYTRANFMELQGTNSLAVGAFWDVVYFRSIFQLPQPIPVEGLPEGFHIQLEDLRSFVENTSTVIRENMNRITAITQNEEPLRSNPTWHFNYVLEHNYLLNAFNDLATAIEHANYVEIVSNLVRLQSRLWYYTAHTRLLLETIADPDLISAFVDFEEFKELALDLFLP